MVRASASAWYTARGATVACAAVVPNVGSAQRSETRVRRCWGRRPCKTRANHGQHPTSTSLHRAASGWEPHLARQGRWANRGAPSSERACCAGARGAHQPCACWVGIGISSLCKESTGPPSWACMPDASRCRNRAHQAEPSQSCTASCFSGVISKSNCVSLQRSRKSMADNRFNQFHTCERCTPGPSSNVSLLAA